MHRFVYRFSSVLICLAVLSLPSLVSAQLVTCSGSDCGTCELVAMIQRIVNFIIAISTSVAVLMFIYAGVLIVTAGGNQGQVARGKSVFTNALIGFVIMLCGWLIVDTMMRTLVGSEVFGRPWNQVECSSQVDLRDAQALFPDASAEWSTVDPASDDMQAMVPTSPGEVSVGGVNVVTNDNMNPIFDPADGGSSLVRPGAAERMQETLSGPFANLQNSFGRPLVINDAIARDGTSRETETPNSRHFYGDALDISLSGMSDADRIRLFNEAQAAGFTGFGFGNNILHIDRGAPRGWAYGNTTFGGQDVNELIAQTRR